MDFLNSFSNRKIHPISDAKLCTIAFSNPYCPGVDKKGSLDTQTDANLRISSEVTDTRDKILNCHWYSAIEMASDQLFADTYPRSSQSITDLLHKELELLRVTKQFATAAKKSVVFLIQSILEMDLQKINSALHRFDFIRVCAATEPILASLYKPLFDKDEVFVRDGMVFTVIHGGRFHHVASTSAVYDQITFSTRDAEKIYANLQKSNIAFMNTILRFNQREAQEFNTDTYSRFSLPVAALVQYFTFRVLVEPLLPLLPNPIDLSVFRLQHMSEDDVNVRVKVLSDSVLTRQLSVMQQFLSLESHPFPCLTSKVHVHHDAHTFGIISCVIHPQYLYCLPYRKISVRRHITFLPHFIPIRIPAHHNAVPFGVLRQLMLDKIRPELLWYLDEAHTKYKSFLLDTLLSSYGRLRSTEVYDLCQDEDPLVNVAHVPSRISKRNPSSETHPVEGKIDPFDVDNERQDPREQLLDVLILQINEVLIQLRDSADISRAFHTLGLPLRFLLKLYRHPMLPTYVRDVLSAEFIARTARHWFTAAIREKISNRLYDYICNVVGDLEQFISKIFMSLNGASTFCERVLYPLVALYWETDKYYVSCSPPFKPTAMHPRLVKNALETHFGIVINDLMMDRHKEHHVYEGNILIKPIEKKQYCSIAELKRTLETVLLHDSDAQSKVSVTRRFTSFYPQSRLVAPEMCLPAVQAAQCVIREILEKSERIGTVGDTGSRALSKLSSHTVQEKECLLKSCDLYIPYVFNVNTLCSVCTFGILHTIKAQFYNRVSPCHPGCARAIKDPGLICLPTLGLRFPDYPKSGADTVELVDPKHLTPCQYFVQIWTALHVVLLARETIGEEWVYCNGTMHEQGNWKLFVALAYICFHHRYISHAKSLANCVLTRGPDRSHITLYAKEVLFQCDLVEDYPENVENHVIRMMTEMNISSNEKPALTSYHFSWYLLYTAMCLQAIEFQKFETGYILAKTALAFSHLFFVGRRAHWCHITSLYFMLYFSYYTDRFLEVENTVHDVLEIFKISAYESLYLKGHILFLMSQTYYETKRWEDSAQMAINAVECLFPKYECLSLLYISCLHQGARGLHKWGTYALESLHLESVILVNMKSHDHLPGEVPIYPCFKPMLFEKDQTKLLAILNNHEYITAQKKGQDLYDATFKCIVGRIQQANIHPLVVGKHSFHDRHNRSLRSQQDNMELPTYVIQPQQHKKNVEYEVHVSRLMSVIKDVVNLRFQSLSFCDRETLVKKLLDTMRNISLPSILNETATKLSTSLLDEIWDAGCEIQTLWRVQPSVDQTFALEEFFMLVSFLFEETQSDTTDTLLYFVLKQCCQLETNDKSCSIKLIKTPNEWFTGMLTQVMKESDECANRRGILLLLLIRDYKTRVVLGHILWHSLSIQTIHGVKPNVARALNQILATPWNVAGLSL